MDLPRRGVERVGRGEERTNEGSAGLYRFRVSENRLWNSQNINKSIADGARAYSRFCPTILSAACAPILLRLARSSAAKGAEPRRDNVVGKSRKMKIAGFSASDGYPSPHVEVTFSTWVQLPLRSPFCGPGITEAPRLLDRKGKKFASLGWQARLIFAFVF